VKYSVYTRAAQDLQQAVRIHAVMEGRAYVTPHDVREMLYPIMRHRIALDYNAGEKDADDVITKILDVVKVPEAAPSTWQRGLHKPS
jgi:MoxR-like ATPase